MFGGENAQNANAVFRTDKSGTSAPTEQRDLTAKS
jgi:hypothetical protein